MASFGIDFGTTNSVLARWTGSAVEVVPIDEPPLEWATLGFDRVLPSVVALDEQGNTSYGWAARRKRGAKVQAVKRLLATDEFVEAGGGRSMLVEEATGLLFAQLRGASAGLTVDRAVVTVPANSLGLARSRTKICAGLSGISVPALINEPTAAAMAYAQSTKRDETVLVFDWGGGTLDVTVLEAVDGVFMERASKGVARLGGLDLDRAFAAAIEADLPPHQWSEADRGDFMTAVELAKVRLSTEAHVELALPGQGRVTVTREQLDRAVAPLIDMARKPIEQCFEDLKMGPGDVDQLVLVGGTSAIPAVREMASTAVGREPAAGVNPMTAVGEGAAIASAILAGELDLDFFVATEHALGTVVHNAGRASFSVLIPRNHQLPAEATDRYLPAVTGQEQVLVRVIEGDPDKPVEHGENVILKEFEVPVDASVDKVDASFDITYRYSVDGLLSVVLTEARTGREMLREEVGFGIARDPRALVALADQVRSTARTGQAGAASVDPQVATVTDQVRRKILPFVGDDERARLTGLVTAVEEAGRDDVSGRLAALQAEMRSYSYLL